MEIPEEMRKHPIAVWAIIGLFTVLSGFSILNIFSSGLAQNLLRLAGVILTGKAPAKLIVEFCKALYSPIFTAASAILFFRLSKYAFHTVLAGLIIAVLITLWQIRSEGLIAALGVSGMLVLLIVWGVLSAICVYAKRLIAAGILS
jgi:hypothetical protein